MKPFKPFLFSSLAATLLLWLPLVIFLRHNHYPLFSPEVMILLGLFALAGLVWGGVMAAGRTVGRVAVVAFLAVLVVDVQTDWITTWGLRLVLNILFFGTIAVLLRRRLAGAVVLLAGLMILGTMVTPTGPAARRAGMSPGEGGAREDLPFVLHLLLDEHAGIEGIPQRYDPERRVAKRISDDYQNLGFTVFGRAYSRYYNTRESIPNALNFTHRTDNEHYYHPHFRKGSFLEENAWFSLLKEAGYRVHVVQTDFMSFHRTDDSEGPRLADGSLTIPSETVGSLVGVEIPSHEKARFILGSYQRMSFFLKMFRSGYGDLRRAGLPLPNWDQSGDRLSILSSLEGVDILGRELEEAGPGKAFFVHLLLPHFPYALQPDCSPRPMSGTWLNAFDESLEPLRNDDQSRDLRYPLYLEQLECSHSRIMEMLGTLAEKPWWEDALVVIHGDHGSRIDRGPPVVGSIESMPAEDFLDAFSTLCVIKNPVTPPGYDRRQLPLDHLMGRILRDGEDPGDPDLESRPMVLIKNGSKDMLPWSLPFFEHGLPDTTMPGPLDP